MEKFKKIGLLNYEVSNHGVVRNIDTKKIITQRKGGTSDYLIVSIKEKGKTKTHLLHRLIAMAFIENPLNKPQVNHIDGNKLNNSVDNLEWVTAKENMLHAFNTGLYKKYNNQFYKGKKGSMHNKSHGVFCKEINKEFGSMSEAERELKLGQGCVYYALKNNTSTHGYTFQKFPA